MEWELTGVPYTSAREPGGIANAIGVLRDLGLAERLDEHGVEDGGDLDLLPPSGNRGPSGVLNEAALERLVDEAHIRVHQILNRGRRPLLVGGDCPVLLGGLASLGGDKRRGLVMIDGHEDAWPPPLSDTGEGSDCELGLALGLFPENMPPPLDRWGALLGPPNVALLGPRDRAELDEAGAESVDRVVRFYRDAEALRGDGGDGAITEALGAVETDSFWLHIDLDVLSSKAFPAVDYPQPGGMSWEQLDSIAARAVADVRCDGVSVVIYNPDLDPDGSAAQDLIAFVDRLVEGTAR